MGTFIGVLGWKWTDTMAETRQLEAFQRPDVAAVPLELPTTAFHDPRLEDLLLRHTPKHGSVGLYVKNVTSGAEANVHGGQVFPAASLYKLPIMAEVVRQARLRRLDLNQELTIGREHWVAGAGILQARIGETLPVRELLRLLIVESDNIAAMMLLDLVGLENVNQTMQGMGMRSTRLLDYRAPNAFSGAGPYVTSPSDIGLLLDTLATGKLVDAAGSETALRLMEGKQANDWLGAGLPWWTKVAHKWGEVPGARHDAGVVFTPRHHYVIVVMTAGLDGQTSAESIRELSRAVFQYFEGAR
ncbi:MAG: serine hydrolase [Chloroflexi bacterium]|nr:serine hydrolase [Chloroflexota bacterium]